MKSRLNRTAVRAVARQPHLSAADRKMKIEKVKNGLLSPRVRNTSAVNNAMSIVCAVPASCASSHQLFHVSATMLAA
jgi:hypothetical protein